MSPSLRGRLEDAPACSGRVMDIPFANDLRNAQPKALVFGMADPFAGMGVFIGPLQRLAAIEPDHGFRQHIVCSHEPPLPGRITTILLR